MLDKPAALKRADYVFLMDDVLLLTTIVSAQYFSSTV